VLSAKKKLWILAFWLMLRGSGIAWDIRKSQPYNMINWTLMSLWVKMVIAMRQYLVRVEEMYQSLKIIKQTINKIPDGPY
jgi:NADH-quinone oxidoreductase subunit D